MRRDGNPHFVLPKYLWYSGLDPKVGSRRFGSIAWTLRAWGRKAVDTTLGVWYTSTYGRLQDKGGLVTASESPTRKIHIILRAETHRKLRVAAALEDESIQKLVEGLIERAVASIKLPRKR